MDRHGLVPEDKKKISEVLRSIDSVMGVLELDRAEEDPAVEKLIETREEARKNKDWAVADRIRDELKGMGSEVIDTRAGAIWRREREEE